MKYAILLTLVFAVNAMAQQDHTCQGGHNCNVGGEGGGGTQEQSVSAENVVEVIQGDIVNDNIVDISVSYSSEPHISVDGGGASSNAEAGGGTSEANSVINVQGDSYERQAASAATVYSSYCTAGASGQTMGGGAAISNADVLCDHLKVADRMLIAYQQEVAICQALEPVCDEGRVIHYWNQYSKNLDSVNRIMNQTSITGQVSKTAGQLVLPAALIWLVFLL